MGNLPKRRRTGMPAGNPTRTYAVKFTPRFAPGELFLKSAMPKGNINDKIKEIQKAQSKKHSYGQ